MNPLNAKEFSYLRAQAFLLRSTGLSVKEIAKKLEKSERWVIKWSSRNEGFEDKKQTGRPKVLNEAAKKVLKKAKCKRENSTRQLSQQLASKGLVEGKNTIWRFMKSKRWRPLKRQKKLLLTAKQHAARMNFAKQYKNLTTGEWDDFLFSDECPNICFSCLIPKMILFGGLRRAKYLLHTR